VNTWYRSLSTANAWNEWGWHTVIIIPEYNNESGATTQKIDKLKMIIHRGIQFIWYKRQQQTFNQVNGTKALFLLQDITILSFRKEEAQVFRDWIVVEIEITADESQPCLLSEARDARLNYYMVPTVLIQ
jgi:hypothetical protein